MTPGGAPPPPGVTPHRHGPVAEDNVSPAILRFPRPARQPQRRSSPTLGGRSEQNPLAEALLGIQTAHRGLARQHVYRWSPTPIGAQVDTPSKTTSCTQRHLRSASCAAPEPRRRTTRRGRRAYRRATQHSSRVHADMERGGGGGGGGGGVHKGRPATRGTQRIAHPTIGLIALSTA